MVGRREVLHVARVRRTDNLHKRSKPQAQCTHQLLIHLRNERMLRQILLDLLRHQLRFLLVSEAEILADDFELLFVDVLQVFEFGASASDGHISRVIF